MNKQKYHTGYELIKLIEEPYQTACANILEECWDQMKNARGSTHNHQAWFGGYLDHIKEVMNLAVLLYEPMNAQRQLPFSLSEALVVLFLHDLEKPWAFEEKDGKWQRSINFKSKKECQDFRMQKCLESGLQLPESLKQAISFVEGELEHYSNQERVMSPLAAFCHMCDVASARIWFDHPWPNGDDWGGDHE